MDDIRVHYVDLVGYKYPYRLWDNGTVERYWARKGWKKLKPFLQRAGGKPGSGRLTVTLVMANGKNKKFHIALEVARNFIGPVPPGHKVLHKNGCKTDCAVSNLMYATQSTIGKIHGGYSRKPVVTVDRHGRILDVYPSVSIAAKKCHVSRNAIYNRIRGRIKNPFDLTGYSFMFEE